MDITPDQLRYLADLLESNQARASCIITYEHQEQYYYFTGQDDRFKYDFRQNANEKTFDISITSYGDVEWQDPQTEQWVKLDRKMPIERRASPRYQCGIGYCDLPKFHKGPHRAPCGCINGCEASDCPNL